MLKRTTVVIFSICLIVLLAGCVVRGVNPEPSSLFMTWLIGQAQERLTEAFPEEQFWGLWDVIGVDEESEVISNRAKTFSEIDRWEFRFAAGEIFGQKTGAIEWLDGEWQEPQIVNDQVMEEAIISDAELADVRYDLDQAIMMLRTSGYITEDDWFVNVTFGRPLILGPGEPYYVFKTPLGEYIAIGSTSGTVEIWY